LLERKGSKENIKKFLEYFKMSWLNEFSQIRQWN
jgi:hypothetical protein